MDNCTYLLSLLLQNQSGRCQCSMVHAAITTIETSCTCCSDHISKSTGKLFPEPVCFLFFFHLFFHYHPFPFPLLFFYLHFLSFFPLSQELAHDHTYVSTDYEPEILHWSSTDYYDDHVKKIQLPYHQVSTKKIQILSNPSETIFGLIKVRARLIHWSN